VPPFDFGAFTRGLSGAATAGLEGKQQADDRAREIQRQAQADLIAKRRADEFVEAGQARRAAAQKKAKADAQKQIDEAEEKKRKEGQDAVQIDLLMQQLPEDKRFPIVGLSTPAVIREINRRLGIANRVPRAGPKPPKDPAEQRQGDILAEARKIRTANPDMAVNEVMSAATLRVDQRASFLENEPQFKATLGAVVGQVGQNLSDRLSGSEDADSRQTVIELVRSLAAQGLSPQAIQDSLKQRGINIPLR
jgi:hypothetical protein